VIFFDVGVGIFFFFLLILLLVFGISNLIDILRNLVVSPIEGPPRRIFFALPLVLHCRCGFGDRMMATPPLFPFVGWLSGP
jgi:hypothetical protein